MDDLFSEIQAKQKVLETALSEMGKRGKDYAAAERDYRIALAQKILMERDKGTPVTIIGDVCRGSREIADMKFKRDVGEVVYKSAMEAINIYKVGIKFLDNQLDREWHSQ